MFHRVATKGVARVLTHTGAGCARRRTCIPADISGVQQRPQQWNLWRGLSDSSAAPAKDKIKPDWTPGTPAPGREQTIGEEFAAMQYHARGTRKVKARVLNSILERVSTEEELKYARLGLKLFKTQGIALRTNTATLFVKACCKVGSPQAAVAALEDGEQYGLDVEGVVSPHRFHFLLTQLYKAGDSETFARAVADARSRQQQLDPRSNSLIARYEEELRVKEEEAARVKAEEERVAREAAEKAKREEEELLAKETAAAAADADADADAEDKKEEEAAKMEKEKEPESQGEKAETAEGSKAETPAGEQGEEAKR